MHAVTPTAGLAAIVVDACTQDVRAFKPGNVAVGAPGHGMVAEDFLRSAGAVAAPLSASGLRVGERIETAIRATWQVVSCNTNLGIVLLLAPLLRAAEAAGHADDPSALRHALQAVLADLDVEDARGCYRAIRQARPGGLGSVPAHDVAAEPAITLLAAMAAAADHDGIAQEYVEGFRRIFEVGLPALQAAIFAGEAEDWAITRSYLTLLADQADSHVARRHGCAVAETARAEAAQLLAAWRGRATAAMWPELRDLDRRWKQAGINPGTTADLVVATLTVMRLQQSHGYNSSRHAPAVEHLRKRPESFASGKRAWAPSH